MFIIDRAIRLQSYLAELVLNTIDQTSRLDFSKVRYIAGLDASYRGGVMCAVAVLIDYAERVLVDKAVVKHVPQVPYIPGLLAFREAPGFFKALCRLKYRPDVVFVDGHGLSHPRGFGIATHIGLALGVASIGVAKRRLFGDLVTVGERILIKAHGRFVGEVIKHLGGELYVSIGYGIRLEDAVELTKQLLTPQYRLPLPTALADELSKRIK